MLQALLDRLLVLLQWLLPERLLGRWVHGLTRRTEPWVKNGLIRLFIRIYPVNLAEAESADPASYPTVNAFFTRALRPGARLVAPDPGAVVSPADGTLEELGYARGEALIQAKRFEYPVAGFLATTSADAARFRDGALLTVYLAPHDYHRVHMPLAGRVVEMVHVPGRRWAVNRRTARTVPDLFGANERVVLRCESAAGPFAVVLVGALNVASISVPWAGEVGAPGRRAPTRWTYAPGLEIPTGGLLGQFNLGSTVVMIAGRGLVTWDRARVFGGQVRMGERLGRACAG